MREHVAGRYPIFGAFAIAATMAWTINGSAFAAETEAGLMAQDETPVSATQVTAGPEVAQHDSLDALEQDELALAQGYHRPPPPRYGHYRVYRPYWRATIVPPPVFAPGWFGFYFLGVQPPPPPSPPRYAAPPAPAPERRQPDFRHVGEYSLAIVGGAYGGEYAYDGSTYNDPGLRFALSYRNAPVLGAELSVGVFGSNMRMDGQGTDARSDIPIQMSAVLHAFPRSPIQPYFLFGATGDIRTYRSYEGSVDPGGLYSEFRVGPHVGVGLELLVSPNMSIVVDGRSVLYTLIDRRAAGQTGQNDGIFTGGLNFYF